MGIILNCSETYTTPHLPMKRSIIENSVRSPTAPKLKRFAPGGPNPSSFQHPADPPHSQMLEEELEFEPEFPTASCGTDVKRLQVKKEGPNTGKYFYSCSCTGKGSAFVWETKVKPGLVIKCKADNTGSDGYVFKIKTEREMEVDNRLDSLEMQLIDLINKYQNLIAELSV